MAEADRVGAAQHRVAEDVNRDWRRRAEARGELGGQRVAAAAARARQPRQRLLVASRGEAMLTSSAATEAAPAATTGCLSDNLGWLLARAEHALAAELALALEPLGLS